MKLFNFVTLITLVFAHSTFALEAEKVAPVTTVNHVDPALYMGSWYEIARFDNWFQESCAATRVNYRLRDNGSVAVKNQCKNKDNAKEIETANGIAHIADTRTNSKLKVSFAPLFKYFGWFSGDYWIIALAQDYSYALVGAPNHNYLWVLSRTPELPASTYQDLLETARNNGFDVNRLKLTPKWTDTKAD